MGKGYFLSENYHYFLRLFRSLLTGKASGSLYSYLISGFTTDLSVAGEFILSD